MTRGLSLRLDTSRVNALKVGDAVRLEGGPPDRRGRIVKFAEEEMIRFALVEWSDGSRSAHPEEDLSLVTPP